MLISVVQECDSEFIVRLFEVFKWKDEVWVSFCLPRCCSLVVVVVVVVVVVLWPGVQLLFFL